MSNLNTVDNFTEHLIKQAEEFKKQWLEKHSKYPDLYPITIPDDNSGLWFEFFMEYYLNGVM